MPISEGKHLVGAFSGHLHHLAFLFVDEAFWAGDVKAEGRLKVLITENTFTIEPKYFSPFEIRNLLHILMSSNSDWVVPAGKDARRYAVFEVSDKRIDDFEYFDRLNAELNRGGIEAMLYDLLHIDLRGWHPKMVYKTKALIDQKAHSLRGLDAWIEGMLQEGRLPIPLSPEYPNRCLSENLLTSARQFDPHTNSRRVADKLKKILDAKPFNTQDLRGWEFPPLPDCRSLWEAHNRSRWDWHHPVTIWAPPRSGKVILELGGGD
jgi:hypothetical protein